MAAPLVATAIAAALLLILLLPGVLVYPDLGDQTAQNNFESERLRKSNNSLEAQLKALQKADTERLCRADGAVPVPGLAPTDPGKPEPPPQMELLPRPPEKTPLPPRAGEPPQAATIAEMSEKSDRVCIRHNAERSVQRSGFFVGDRYIITNRHVVENALDEAHIYVASRTFGARRARVFTKTPPLVKNAGPQPDFAVLEVEPIAGSQRPEAGWRSTKTFDRLYRRVSGFLVAHDVAFDKFIDELKEALTHGDDDQRLAARRFTVPGADSMRAVRHDERRRETPIIVHDMQLAHGNSGGPLVDACGRLGGVNSLFFAEEAKWAMSRWT